MKIEHIAIYVKNLEQEKEFFEKNRQHNACSCYVRHSGIACGQCICR